MKPEITDLQTYFPCLEQFEHRGLLEGIGSPWEAVSRIGSYLQDAIASARRSLPSVALDGVVVAQRSVRAAETMLIVERPVEVSEALVVEGADVVLGEGVILEPGSLIKAPALIGPRSEVRQGAYLRGDVLVGSGCTLGHTTEIKNSVFMNHTEAGHFAYVGDSILGSYVNLGAGTKLANLELRRSADKVKESFPPITLRFGDERLPSGLSKLGAVLGDFVETGCNAVTAPGVLCGAHCWVGSNHTVSKGFYPPRSIIRR